MIKNIVLDMGNVLLNYDPEIPLNLYCDSQEAKDVIRRELFEGPQWVEADLGHVSTSGLFPIVRERVPEKYWDSLKLCCEKWDVCMTELPDAKDFCKEMKARGFGVYVLSNAADSFYHYFPEFLPLTFFDGVVISADVHIVKPDVRIYQYLLEKYRLLPEECLFIDDRQDNVDGAAAAGMRSCQFHGDFDEVRKLLN